VALLALALPPFPRISDPFAHPPLASIAALPNHYRANTVGLLALLALPHPSQCNPVHMSRQR
jgi:hypothetical protein